MWSSYCIVCSAPQENTTICYFAIPGVRAAYEANLPPARNQMLVLQAQQKSMLRTRSSGALADTLASACDSEECFVLLIFAEDSVFLWRGIFEDNRLFAFSKYEPKPWLLSRVSLQLSCIALKLVTSQFEISSEIEFKISALHPLQLLSLPTHTNCCKLLAKNLHQILLLSKQIRMLPQKLRCADAVVASWMSFGTRSSSRRNACRLKHS